MHHVIIRDDDTNALTPPGCLERLYRPFLERGLPVNLATIPNVRTDAVTPAGEPEGFLVAKRGYQSSAFGYDQNANSQSPIANRLPIGSNQKLVQHLLTNPGYQILQHGYQHDCFEFDTKSRPEISRRIEHGTALLQAAGFPKPLTFVAPHDKFSRVSFTEVSRRFPVISTGWFEWRRLPRTWWPNYLQKKFSRAPHWQVNGTALLSHPGCLLSCHRPLDTMLDEIIRRIESQPLLVLVTHWWEYFPGGEPNDKFIAVLHALAGYLARNSKIKVVTFADVARKNVGLN